MSETSQDIPLQSREILQTNVHKILRLCGAISFFSFHPITLKLDNVTVASMGFR